MSTPSRPPGPSRTRTRSAGVKALVGLVALLAVVLVAGGLWLVSDSPVRGAPAPDGPPAATVSDAAVDDGRQLYVQSCASCHGPQGTGTQLGPAVVESGLAAWDFMLRTGRMPAAAPEEPVYRQEPAFSEDQIQALLAYAGTIVTAGPDIPDVSVDPRQVAHGFELYIQNCAACHAATAAGDAVGGGFIAPSLLESDATMIGEAILIGPGAMPEFPFLEDDIAAIATYVESLRGEEGSRGGISLGGLGPVAEGFVAVFFGLGALVVVTRFVGRAEQ